MTKYLSLRATVAGVRAVCEIIWQSVVTIDLMLSAIKKWATTGVGSSEFASPIVE